MMAAFRRRTVVTGLVAVVMLALSLGVTVAPAAAQIAVVGSADFRNAPALEPGQYSDRLVTGDTAWYALVYTNDTPFRFEVSLPGIDLAASPELSLTAAFVAPTLRPEGEPAALLEGDGVSYPKGDTNIWFLKVSLATTGTVGLEYPLLIDIEGVESVGFDDCSVDPTCTLDDEFDAVDSELREVEEALADVRLLPQQAAVELEIANFRGFAETAAVLLPAAVERAERAEATMVALCAPEPTCTTFPEQPPQTPLIGWLFGGVAVLGGAARAAQKVRSPAEATG